MIIFLHFVVIPTKTHGWGDWSTKGVHIQVIGEDLLREIHKNLISSAFVLRCITWVVLYDTLARPPFKIMRSQL
ncbi:hypothetical protein DID88_007415 [Monilinia fructigena]|uniref:Uncharacterized protein n=1 Tax=Monilinia fructigena TaxID=38457 RepID=A0A395J8A0_9HELO|nr:hypothetical protein DID88_007415 [Monilinia fructigena]